MKVIIKSHMFFVLDVHGNEKACFKSLTRLMEYIKVVEKMSQ